MCPLLALYDNKHVHILAYIVFLPVKIPQLIYKTNYCCQNHINYSLNGPLILLTYIILSLRKQNISLQINMKRGYGINGFIMI